MIYLYSDRTNTVSASLFDGKLHYLQRIWLGRHLISSSQKHGHLRLRLSTKRLSAKLGEVITHQWIVKRDTETIEVMTDKDFLATYHPLFDDDGEKIPDGVRIGKDLPEVIRMEDYNMFELISICHSLYQSSPCWELPAPPFSWRWKKPQLISYINDMRSGQYLPE